MTESFSSPYVPRSLLALQEAIRRCADPRESKILRAKCASVLAINSNIEHARNIISELRSENQGFEPRLSAWLMYCDGILIHSESLDWKAALDRLKRGYIFGSAVQDRELSASCAAWMAHCYFSIGEVERTVEHLKLAFDFAQNTDHFSIARAALVMADVHAWAGDEAQARKWYKQARASASTSGDISMQNAAIYNSAALRVSNLSLAQCEGTETELMSKLAETEVNSASTLNTLISNINSPALVPLLKAELLTSLGRLQEALLHFESYKSFAASDEHMQQQPKILAGHAYCMSMVGDRKIALLEYQTALSNKDLCQELDDAVILLHRCSQTAAALGDREASEKLYAEAKFTLVQFRSLQSTARDLFQQVLGEQC